jgi:hypothetical protein
VEVGGLPAQRWAVVFVVPRQAVLGEAEVAVVVVDVGFDFDQALYSQGPFELQSLLELAAVGIEQETL